MRGDKGKTRVSLVGKVSRRSEGNGAPWATWAGVGRGRRRGAGPAACQSPESNAGGLWHPGDGAPGMLAEEALMHCGAGGSTEAWDQGPVVTSVAL